MSLILTSSSAPSPAPSATASTRRDEQAQDNPGSFGAALARSLAPAAEKTDKPVAKTAPAQSGRRQADPEKTDAQDLANAMVLSLLPIEARVPQATLAGGAVTGTATRNSAVAGTPLMSLNDLLAGTPAGADAANAANAADGAVGAASAADAAVEVIAADADTLPQLASVLAAGNQKMAGTLALPASLTPVSDGAAMEIDPLLAAAQAIASGSGLPDPNASGTDKEEQDPGLPGDAQPDLKLAARQDRVKVTVSGAAENAQASGLPVAGAQGAAEAAATNTSPAFALPMMPATAALQATGGASASNAPIPVAIGSLVPEVGSNEWGKALGQQMTQMGHAGIAGNQVTELQLNPPGLGPLKVTLSISDHQMQAMFVSAHSSVRAAVEAALPQLRAALADSGISLGNTSVGAESQQQTAFSNHQNNQPGRGVYRPDTGIGADADALLAARSTAEPVRRNSGLRIDTFA